MTDHDLFQLGDVRLSTGQPLRDAKLAYKTYGTLNADKSNAIVSPTWYSGQHQDDEWLIGEGMALVTGWSMGAGQTYQWAVSYPDMVERGPALLRFLEDRRAQRRVPRSRQVRHLDRRRLAGRPVRRPAGQGVARGREGLRRVGAVDVGNTPGFDGDHERALASIKARMIVMPTEKDLYFPPEDEAYAVGHIPGAELRVIPGVWGHVAGGGVNPDDTASIDAALTEMLSS